jgi:hypothetical protein
MVKYTPFWRLCQSLFDLPNRISRRKRHLRGIFPKVFQELCIVGEKNENPLKNAFFSNNRQFLRGFRLVALWGIEPQFDG